MSSLIDQLQVFNVVKVKYRNSGNRTYSYKTTGTHEVGDEVIVLTPQNESMVVEVVGFVPYNDLKPIEGVKYKWIVGVVDLTEYHYQIEQEKVAEQTLLKLRDQTNAKKVRKELLSGFSDQDLVRAEEALRNIGNI